MASSSRIALFLLFAVGCAVGEILYEDDFTGSSLDSSKWVIEVTGNPNNNELEYYTDRADNVYVQDGHLVIKPIKENYGGREYTSGRIHSKFAWQYGRVEVRAKLPNGYGLWPAIWMMPRDSVYGGWPESGEIDIMEARGQNLNEIASTIHYGICCDNHYWESSGELQLQCSIDEYHVYTLDWTPTELVYSLDGEPYFTQNLDRIISWMYGAPGQPFDEFFYMILNVAIGGDYLDNPKPTTTWNYPDAEMWVDYVKVYPLDDVATLECSVKGTASYGDVCGNVNWACYQQYYADVDAECTDELLACCENENSCELLTVKTLATAVYASYDAQVDNADSCDFSGTAERKWVLHDGYAPYPQCLIKDSATPDEICGAMQWACGSGDTYADVSTECNDGGDVLSCCAAGAYTCDETRLREAAGAVFQAYYAAIPSSSSCDFDGVCYLGGVEQPLPCTNGYQ